MSTNTELDNSNSFENLLLFCLGFSIRGLTGPGSANVTAA